MCKKFPSLEVSELVCVFFERYQDEGSSTFLCSMTRHGYIYNTLLMCLHLLSTAWYQSMRREQYKFHHAHSYVSNVEVLRLVPRYCLLICSYLPTFRTIGVPYLESVIYVNWLDSVALKMESSPFFKRALTV